VARDVQLERVLGTIPVEPDGSACVELPANRPVFFVALDENDLSVKAHAELRQRRPGETTSCVGCHEERTRTPLPGGAAPIAAALAKRPRKIAPIEGVPDVIDFQARCPADPRCPLRPLPRLRQARRAGGARGDTGLTFSHSYWALCTHAQVAGRPERVRESAAAVDRELGEPAHAQDRREPLRGDALRARADDRLALDRDRATYAGTYAASNPSRASSAIPRRSASSGRHDVFRRRCTDCHALPGTPGGGTGSRSPRSPSTARTTSASSARTTRSHASGWRSSSTSRRPEKSPILLGPLAAAAGGYGSCRKDGAVFESTGDATISSFSPPSRRRGRS